MSTDPSTWPGLVSSQITSRTVTVKDLEMHILEAVSPSIETNGELPLVVLLHGFPELAYSWRKVMPLLAGAGYHVVAPDQRGYGRTRPSGTDFKPVAYDDDLTPYQLPHLAHDIFSLVRVLRPHHPVAAAVIGHDFGSIVAGHCALLYPSTFPRLVLMSAPFHPGMVGQTLRAPDDALGRLDPPRKHYTSYFAGREAGEDMSNAQHGLSEFLEGYFWVKSGEDGAVGAAGGDAQAPYPLVLTARTPEGVAKALEVLPHYYLMPLEKTMPEVVRDAQARGLPAAGKWEWLSPAELKVYEEEYARTGFQGGLNWYRALTSPTSPASPSAPPPHNSEIPALFIAGSRDWGVFTSPGSADLMREKMLRREDRFVLVEGAGHWVQQERWREVGERVLRFLREETSARR